MGSDRAVNCATTTALLLLLKTGQPYNLGLFFVMVGSCCPHAYPDATSGQSLQGFPSYRWPGTVFEVVLATPRGYSTILTSSGRQATQPHTVVCARPFTPGLTFRSEFDRLLSRSLLIRAWWGGPVKEALGDRFLVSKLGGVACFGRGHPFQCGCV